MCISKKADAALFALPKPSRCTHFPTARGSGMPPCRIWTHCPVMILTSCHTLVSSRLLLKVCPHIVFPDPSNKQAEQYSTADLLTPPVSYFPTHQMLLFAARSLCRNILTFQTGPNPLRVPQRFVFSISSSQHIGLMFRILELGHCYPQLPAEPCFELVCLLCFLLLSNM